MLENSDHVGQARTSRKRIIIWSIPVVLLVGIAIAMQFTKEINWSAIDFIIAGVLLYGSLGAFQAVSRLSNDSIVRAAFGLGIAGSLFLLWANGAVGLTDSAADGFYIVVVIIAISGSFYVRFRPQGMALVMLLTAIGQALVGAVALIMEIVPPHNPPLEIVRIAIIFGAPFVISAFLFRKAALES